MKRTGSALETSRGTALVVLGRSSEEIVSLCDALRTALNGLLQHIEAELANDSIKFGSDPLAEAVSDLTSELTDTRLRSVGIGGAVTVLDRCMTVRSQIQSRNAVKLAYKNAETFANAPPN
jgi:hypothetical protein